MAVLGFTLSIALANIRSASSVICLSFSVCLEVDPSNVLFDARYRRLRVALVKTDWRSKDKWVKGGLRLDRVLAGTNESP